MGSPFFMGNCYQKNNKKGAGTHILTSIEKKTERKKCKAQNKYPAPFLIFLQVT